MSILYFARGIVLILFLILPTSTYVAIGFGILYGFLWLATIPPTNGIISQVFGTKYLATLYGIVFFSHQIGSFLGAYLGGYFYDQYGSFDYAWYLAIVLSSPNLFDFPPASITPKILFSSIKTNIKH